MSVTLKLSNGSTKALELHSFNITVSEFKEIAATVVDIPATSQRVVFRGKVLKDADVLAALGVEAGVALHIVRGQSAQQSALPAAVVTPVAAPSTAPAPISPPVPAQPIQQNPYAALFSTTASESPSNAWATSGFGSGWGAPPSEAMAMMQNPMVAQMVAQMMQNPQMVQQLIASNPALRNMPPEVVQQSMQLMSNPQMMADMMRLMGGGGNSNATAHAPLPFAAAVANPREAYAAQLEQLRAMGFPNEQANIAALQQSQGNIEFAIERLLGA